MRPIKWPKCRYGGSTVIFLAAILGVLSESSPSTVHASAQEVSVANEIKKLSKLDSDQQQHRPQKDGINSPLTESGRVLDLNQTTKKGEAVRGFVFSDLSEGSKSLVQEVQPLLESSAEKNSTEGLWADKEIGPPPRQRREKHQGPTSLFLADGAQGVFLPAEQDFDPTANMTAQMKKNFYEANSVKEPPAAQLPPPKPWRLSKMPPLPKRASFDRRRAKKYRKKHRKSRPSQDESDSEEVLRLPRCHRCRSTPTTTHSTTTTSSTTTKPVTSLPRSEQQARTDGGQREKSNALIDDGARNSAADAKKRGSSISPSADEVPDISAVNGRQEERPNQVIIKKLDELEYHMDKLKEQKIRNRELLKRKVESLVAQKPMIRSAALVIVPQVAPNVQANPPHHHHVLHAAPPVPQLALLPSPVLPLLHRGPPVPVAHHPGVQFVHPASQPEPAQPVYQHHHPLYYRDHQSNDKHQQDQPDGPPRHPQNQYDPYHPGEIRYNNNIRRGGQPVVVRTGGGDRRWDDGVADWVPRQYDSPNEANSDQAAGFRMVNIYQMNDDELHNPQNWAIARKPNHGMMRPMETPIEGNGRQRDVHHRDSRNPWPQQPVHYSKRGHFQRKDKWPHAGVQKVAGPQYSSRVGFIDRNSFF